MNIYMKRFVQWLAGSRASEASTQARKAARKRGRKPARRALGPERLEARELPAGSPLNLASLLAPSVTGSTPDQLIDALLPSLGDGLHQVLSPELASVLNGLPLPLASGGPGVVAIPDGAVPAAQN